MVTNNRNKCFRLIQLNIKNTICPQIIQKLMFTTIPTKSELLGVDWKTQFQKASGGKGCINVRKEVMKY